MGKRKLFLLFLSAMSFSIIIMVIIYGVFIKDMDISFNVKNPESAPSPIDAFNRAQVDTSESEGTKVPAKVSSPEEAQPQETADNTQTTPNPNAQETITEVVPLEPQVTPQDGSPEVPLPDAPKAESGPSSRILEAGSSSQTPSLHFVYLDGFSSREAAEEAIKQLQDRKLSSQPYIRQHRGQVVLQFGIFSDRENADALAQQLRNQRVFVKVD
jgi:hypothetical protein